MTAESKGSESKQEYYVTIAGRINDPAFQQARVLGRFLEDNNSRVVCKSIELTEAQWEVYAHETAKLLGDAAQGHRISPLIHYNDSVYIGRTPQLVSWMKYTFDIDGKAGNSVLFKRMANTAYHTYIDDHPHPHAFMDLAVGDGAPQRVVFELYDDVCPKTCENFLALCTGERGSSDSGLKLDYEGTPIHRVVRGGWVQGGDIGGGHGDGGESVFGGTFADESFAIKHDAAGVLSMASTGGSHTNGSQFFVTLGPAPYLDGNRVAFGRVISGMRTIRTLEKLPSKNQRPQPEVTVALCGRFTSAVYGTMPGSEDARNAESIAETLRARRAAAAERRKAAAEAKAKEEAEAAAKAAAIAAEEAAAKAEEGKAWAAVNHPGWLSDWLAGNDLSNEAHNKVSTDVGNTPAMQPGKAAEEMGDWMERDFEWAFNGEWQGHGDSEGWRYAMLYRVRPVRARATGWPAVPAGSSHHVDGFIRWTLLEHPEDQPEYAKRIGHHAIEVVAGHATRANGDKPLSIELRGYRIVDPREMTSGVGLIVVDQYRITVEGSDMKGVSRGHDTGWNNQLQATAVDV